MLNAGREEITEFHVDNGQGHRLYIKRTVVEPALVRARRPLLIVPGYGMNSFIFGYHPRGTSLSGYMARQGFEVWTFDLRDTGMSKRLNKRAEGPSLEAYIADDLPVVIDAVLRRTVCDDASKVDVLGASLGGTIVYGHLALRGAERSQFGSVVTIGAPLRWDNVHPALRLAFKSPWLMSKVRISGARKIAKAALPIIERVPQLLSIYMNPAIVDLSKPQELVKTVEDPNPRVNADIARWINAGDLKLSGVNVTEALKRVDTLPLLLVLANKDGIVPTETAMSAKHAWGGPVETLHVGDEQTWYAHADLFIGDPAPGAVFEPIASFLMQRGGYAKAG